MRGRLRAGRASAEAPPGDLSRISIDVERIQVETRRLGHHDGVVEWRLVSPWSGSPLPAPNAQ